MLLLGKYFHWHKERVMTVLCGLCWKYRYVFPLLLSGWASNFFPKVMERTFRQLVFLLVLARHQLSWSCRHLKPVKLIWKYSTHLFFVSTLHLRTNIFSFQLTWPAWTDANKGENFAFTLFFQAQLILKVALGFVWRSAVRLDLKLWSSLLRTDFHGCGSVSNVHIVKILVVLNFSRYVKY